MPSALARTSHSINYELMPCKKVTLSNQNERYKRCCIRMMSFMKTKRASDVLNYNPGTFDNYLHHWFDAPAGQRYVPEGITSPVVSISVLT